MLHPIHLEVRLAFRSCARTYSISKSGCRYLNSSTALGAQKRDNSRAIESLSPTESVKEVTNAPNTPQPSPPKESQQEPSRSNTKSLVSRIPPPGNLQRPRTLNVPARLLPKAQISPGLTLTPQERLQIEYETRRPPQALDKRVFKERLLIYHRGLGFTNYIVLLRVATMVGASYGLFMMAPAFYFYESAPWWTVPLILVGTTAPFFLGKFLLRPYVAWIYLILPPHARQSPRAALEYSKALPQDALLQIWFMRATALPGQIEAKIADLVPQKGLWPPATFKWVGSSANTGTWLRGNPTHFFVNERSGTGKAARDTVPGIWENVYKRIMCLDGGRKAASSK